LLEVLAGLSPSGETDLAGAAERFDRRFPRAGWAILVSDLRDCVDDLDRAMARLADRDRQVIVLHTFSPGDADPPLDGHHRLRHAETGKEINVTVTADLRESYRRRWKKFCSRIERETLKRGGTYIAAPSDLPFESLILQALRRAGVLG
jgi:hypothetical protein